MSSRQLRKLKGLKRQELDDNLKKFESDEKVDDNESDEEDEPSPPAKQNSFSLLMIDNNEVDQDDDEDESLKDTEVKETIKPLQTPASKSKKKKKGKAKAISSNTASNSSTTSGKKDTETLDEVELALNEVNARFGEWNVSASSSSTNPTQSSKRLSPIAELLSVDRRYLDADAEMRRMFGSKVVKDEIKRKNYAKTIRKTILATPRDTWPRMETLGLRMDKLESDGEGNSWFSYIYSKSYLEAQAHFIACVQSYNPHSIANLLHKHPSHTDALLQMSEIQKHSGDWSSAAELLERCLFSFERAWHPMFNVAVGTCRLSYERPENRGFFLALFRHSDFVSRRGGWRTAFEVNKLLLSLNPNEDPLAAFLSIDFYAIKAKQFDWIGKAWDLWGDEKKLKSLPNMNFSLAYITREQQGDNGFELKSEASLLLQRAIVLFPWTIPFLYEKCGVVDDFVSTSQGFLMPDEANESQKAMKYLMNLYVERNYQIWKEPEVLEWLKANVRVCINRMTASSDTQVAEGKSLLSDSYPLGLPRNVLRHIFISEYSSVASALPMGEPLLSFDPLPPIIEGQKRIPGSFLDMLRSMIPGENGGAGVSLQEQEQLERTIRESLGVANEGQTDENSIFRRLLSMLGLDSNGEEDRVDDTSDLSDDNDEEEVVTTESESG